MPGSVYTHPVYFRTAVPLLGKINYVSIRQCRLFFSLILRSCQMLYFYSLDQTSLRSFLVIPISAS